MSNPLNDKLKEFDEVQLSAVYKNVFATPEGQLVLEDLRNRCHFYTPLPYGEAGMRGEGMREILISIESRINYEPEKKKEGDDE